MSPAQGQHLPEVTDYDSIVAEYKTHASKLLKRFILATENPGSGDTVLEEQSLRIAKRVTYRRSRNPYTGIVVDSLDKSGEMIKVYQVNQGLFTGIYFGRKSTDTTDYFFEIGRIDTVSREQHFILLTAGYKLREIGTQRVSNQSDIFPETFTAIFGTAGDCDYINEIARFHPNGNLELYARLQDTCIWRLDLVGLKGWSNPGYYVNASEVYRFYEDGSPLMEFSIDPDSPRMRWKKWDENGRRLIHIRVNKRGKPRGFAVFPDNGKVRIGRLLRKQRRKSQE